MVEGPWLDYRGCLKIGGMAREIGPWLGRALREHREQRLHISQEEAAHRGGITVRHLQKIEYGETDPHLELMMRLAAGLDTKLQRLLDRAEELQRSRRR